MKVIIRNNRVDMKLFRCCFSSLVLFNAVIFVRSQGEPTCLTDEKAKAFNERMVELHNNYRTLHGVPPLKANDELMTSSIEWSKDLVSKGVMEHSSPPENNPYGENLYHNTGTTIDELELNPVKPWYEEIEFYDFGQGGFNEKTGHFTQVIWKSSENVGCGVCSGSTGVFATCRYSPAGNFLNRFEENVLPPKSGDGTLPVESSARSEGTDSPTEETILTTESEPTSVPDVDLNVTEVLLFITASIFFIFTLVAVIGMLITGVYYLIKYFKTNNPDDV